LVYMGRAEDGLQFSGKIIFIRPFPMDLFLFQGLGLVVSMLCWTSNGGEGRPLCAVSIGRASYCRSETTLIFSIGLLFFEIELFQLLLAVKAMDRHEEWGELHHPQYQQHQQNNSPSPLPSLPSSLREE